MKEIFLSETGQTQTKYSQLHKFGIKKRMVYTLVEDLQEAIMGIAYPFTKDSEHDNSVDGEENLVESLRKLIMGKFENENNEFYEWSRTIHDEVVTIVLCFIF